MSELTLQHISVRDDGTLDTIVECTCPLCNEELEYRFSQELMFIYGNDAGLAATEAWEQELCGMDH